MKVLRHLIPNGAGWHLGLTQTWDPAKLDPKKPPVLIVPGYGMNSFIFSYHPNGVSLEGHLCEMGFEVWRADLREQGSSVRVGKSPEYGLEELATVDLPAVVEAALDRTRTTHDKIDVIGASLGGSLTMTYAVLNPDHKMRAIVAMGSPVRWIRVHPLVRIAFVSPMLAGLVRVRGTRRFAERAMPLLVKHSPWLLSIYMNPELTDTTAIAEMVHTVEDPNRYINRELARWIKRRDLVVKGVNIAEKLRSVKTPFLCVLAHGDGVVPRETAAFSFHQIGSKDKELLIVGDELMRHAHADLFVSTEAHERVFRPISTWLNRGAGVNA